MIEVQAIESSSRDSRSGIPSSSSERTPSKNPGWRDPDTERRARARSGPDPGRGAEPDPILRSSLRARRPGTHGSPLGSSAPEPPGLVPSAEQRPPDGPAALPHAPAAGRPRPPTRCPPRGAARRFRARGPARTRTRAAVPGHSSCGLSTRVRVLLTNGPGARGGHRRGSPVRGSARPWSLSAPQGRRCLLRSPPSLAPPKPARRRSARPRRAGAGRAAGSEWRAARLELVTDWKEGAEADPGSGLQAGRAPASPTFHQSQTVQRSR